MSRLKFGDMLTEAVHLIKLKEAKTISIIEDELGFSIGRQGGSPISYWRRGNSPPNVQETEMLAKELIRRGDFGSKWLEEFLIHAEYPQVEKFSEELFPSRSPQPNSMISQGLPPRNFSKLIGRKEQIETILSFLNKSEASSIVTIDGQGGIGKTAIAIEVAHQSKQESIFEKIIWIMAPTRIQNGVFSSVPSITFETIIDKIGLDLEIQNFFKLDLSRKKSQIKSILEEIKILIVLDNMETANEDQDKIISKILPLLGKSKLLSTSRQRFSGDFFSINLEGINVQMLQEFITQDSNSKGISLELIKLGQLNSIYNTTGGSPLAIKLVISQLRQFSIEDVLFNLKNATPLTNKSNDSEYVSFYKFVFFQSWGCLRPIDQEILVSMTHFNQSDGASSKSLQQITKLETGAIIKSIENLWDFSFLEVKRLPHLQIRYYLHPLTQHFILTDVVQPS